jgi:hypothetical protein
LYVGGSIISSGGVVGAGGATGSSGTGTTTTFVITNITASASTQTGALQVRGGAGIGGTVNVGGSMYAGNVYTNGQQIIPQNIQELTASAGQTIFTIPSGYTVGTEQVYVNGVLFGSSDYTAADGSTIVLSIPRALNDVIRVISGQTSTTPISSVNSLKSFSVAMSIAMGL